MSDPTAGITMQSAVLRSVGSLELRGAQSGSLEQAFEEFKISRDKLKEQLESTESLLTNEFSSKLSNQFSDQLRENLKLEKVKQNVDQLYKGSSTGSQDNSKPCIIIVGQTKSGKSSFINELLGGTFVAQSQSPCTARVTRLTYSDKNYVLIRKENGELEGDVMHLEKPFIKEEFVKLKDEDRENNEKICSTVEAGINCEFLKHGIDILDSPGLNENPSLDKLTHGAIATVLPIIIYVIDSNSGVSITVQEDLTTIHKSVADVLYLVTKMDVSKEAVEDEGRSAEEIENEKAERVFNKLKSLGFIGEGDTMESCDSFLCVSCWSVRDFRRKRDAYQKKMQNHQADQQLTAVEQKQLSEVEELQNSKWVRRFEEVKKKILNFAQNQFCAFLTSAGEHLKDLHSQILTMFMDKAHNLHESHMKKKKAFEQIKKLELIIYEQSKAIIERHRKEFQKQVKLDFEKNIPCLVQETQNMEYSESTIITPKMTSKDIEEKCFEQIVSFINDRIMVNFKNYLRQGALKHILQELDGLRANVAEYEKEIDQTPAYMVLKKTLMQEFALSPTDIQHHPFVRFFKNLGLHLRAIKHAKVLFDKEVKNPIWKKHQASKYLNSIDQDILADVMVNSIREWFDDQHKSFLESLHSSERIVESVENLNEMERMEIKSLYPKVALLYMHTMDVVTRYKFRGFHLDMNESIGSGGQGDVYRLLDENGSPALAAKRIKSDDENLGDIAAEVYHSSVLDHPNLIRVIGVRVTKFGRQWIIDLYMELMHCDIRALMQETQLSLKQRLAFGLELAKALEFLHSNDLIHRDVKPSNLLVSKDYSHVKLADFGMARLAGMVEHTVAGTPIFMAPELIVRGSYDTSVDIFSLGITLWYICEGSGQNHPLYVQAFPTVNAALILGAVGMRPEPLDGMPVALWALMNACWSAIPSERPTASDVADFLQMMLVEDI